MEKSLEVPQPRSIDMIERLVGFDTVSSKSNLELIDFVRDLLAEHGVESRLVHDDTGKKANLYATVGAQDQPGIMLSGHTDVVPVDGQNWTSDPFTVDRRDGRLYGRGTSDMKSFIAVVLACLPDMLEKSLRMPIHLAFSYDEEIGCVGARRLVELISGLEVKPALCVVGEPTEMKVAVAHKGKRAMRVHVRGLECHSSLVPYGVNAIEYAADLIVFIRSIADRVRESGPQDDGYDVTYSTLHTGLIEGGIILNTVPADCSFEFEIRNLPNEDAESYVREIQTYAKEVLEPRMHAVDPSSGFTFEDLSGYPGLDTDPAHEIVTLAKSLAGENAEIKIAFGTEGGLFSREAGVPTVVCGPGSIAQAHKPDEYISLEQVAQCERFMQRLLDHLEV